MAFFHNYHLSTKPNLSKRSAAGFIDYGIIFTYLFIIIYLYGEPNDEGGYSVKGWPAFSVMLFWFIMTIGMELSLGATLGNYIQNLKAVPKADPRKKLTFGQSLKRHLLDFMDFQFFGLIAVIAIKNTEYNQRIGDLWAKTVVLDRSDLEQGLKEKENSVESENYIIP